MLSLFPEASARPVDFRDRHISRVLLRRCSVRLCPFGGRYGNLWHHVQLSFAEMYRPRPRHLMQLVLVVIMCCLIFEQYMQYDSERLLTMSSRRQGDHPRLTVCPYSTMAPYFTVPAHRRLANRSISIVELYDAVTINLLGTAGTLDDGNRIKYFSDTDGPGVWRQKFYSPREDTIARIPYTRCITFEPKKSQNIAGGRNHPIRIRIQESPFFKMPESDLTGIQASYRLYVHGEEVPNVADLPEWAPITESVPLRTAELVHYSISARRTERVSVRRRPCSSGQGYSKAQCLKECRWRRLAEHIGCRLPHMVGADTFLPEIRGFMDHLPLCLKVPMVKKGKEFQPFLPKNYLLE